MCRMHGRRLIQMNFHMRSCLHWVKLLELRGGLSADTIASLPSVNYEAGSIQNGSNDSCVICRLDYDDGDTLTVLSCKHSYHSECLNDWLK
ncbi:hypothetical protein GH714_040199 [Hevea brasiliensis]|uniref:RING-type domain-containing protein n=1 Tax=Hevea brasiliensis TaxID=3981 RepID=A0A6A6LQ92_HEVBR|nr:hypothetical protein GH714_040199 [Hevea brasiliensis]